MSHVNVMALDAGTGSCRAIIFESSGRELGSAQREWRHKNVPGVPGGIDFDTQVNGKLVDQVVYESLVDAGIPASDIAAVSTTSMREGIVLYDESGTELWACPNIDSRASAEANELVSDGRAARIFDLAGDWVSITTPARLLWLQRHHPELLARACVFNMLSDWLVTRLTGVFSTTPSAGSSTAMFDLSTRTWSSEIFACCGIDESLQPPVYESGEHIGGVTPQAANRCGLRPQTPVFAGGGDTQLALVGLNQQPGDAALVGGSLWQMTATLDAVCVDPNRAPRTLCHALPQQWMIEQIGFLSGFSLRWIRDTFSLDADTPLTFEEVEAAALEEVPGASGVFAFVANMMQTDSWIQGPVTLTGLDMNAGGRETRARAFRAIMEAAAFVSAAHRDYLEALLDRKFNTITFTGGGAGGQLWPQIVADVLNTPISVPRVKETTALGCAILAAYGCGSFNTLNDAIDSMATTEERLVSPDPASVAEYTRLRTQWQTISDLFLDLTHKGVLPAQWWPAGALTPPKDT